MNLNTDEIRLVLWPWGRDVANSVDAIRYAENGTDLATMAEDVIAGKIASCQKILGAFAACAAKVPVEQLYCLAKRFPECRVFGSTLCSRADATPAMLDEWAEDSTMAWELANNPSTSRASIDRLVRSVRPGEQMFNQLANYSPEIVQDALVLAHDDTRLNAERAMDTSNPVVLEKLARCPNYVVRRCIANNRATSTALLNEMAVREPEAEVLVRIVRRLTSKRILDQVAEKLCDLKSPQLARAILRHRRASDVAKTVAVMFLTPPPEREN